MSMTVEQIAEEALSLPSEARALLADRLVESLDPADKLRAMLKDRVMSRVRAISDYHESLDELFEVVRPAYIERRKQYFAVEQELICRALEQGVEAGKFQVANPMVIAGVMLQATNAYLPYSLSVRELGAPGQIEKQLGMMVDVLIRGVASGG